MAKQATLADIVRELEDDEAVGKVTGKHDDARSSYKGGKKKATNKDAAVKEVARYIKHHRKEVDKTEMSDADARVEAYNFLVAYGRNKLGERGKDVEDEVALNEALKDTRKGRVRDILDSYKLNERSHAESRYVEDVFVRNVDPLDHKHNTAIVKEYLGEHGHLLTKADQKKYEQLPPEALAHKTRELIAHHRGAKAQHKDTTTHYKG